MKSRRMFPITAAALLCTAGLAQAQINENFDTVATGPILAGWSFQNNAVAIGLTPGYFPGNTAVFLPFASAGYMAANYNNCTGTNTISTFGVTPQVLLENGKVLSFYARTVDNVAFPDRLQVRMSTAGASTNVGALADPTAVGDFTTLLLDINPTYTLTGFPNAWTQYNLTLSGLPAGGVQGRFAFRYFVEGGGPTGANSDFIGLDEVVYPSSTTTGACCFPDGSCTLQTSAACASGGGTYAGDNVTCVAANCPQPPTGACCTDTGTCSLLTSFACAASGGTWAGANVTCAAANCQPGWVEVGEAGDTLGTAQVVAGPGNALVPFISGSSAATGDADLYKINICNEAAFLATTANAQTTSDTQLFLFNSTGFGIAMDDDDVGVSNTLQSRITSQFVTANGDYYLGIAFYNTDPQDAAAALIWNNQNNGAAFGPEWAPNGPGAANALASWNGGASGTGTYRISLSGTCFVATAVACYPNCDQSTSNPLLTANDFQCFLNAYAANSSYANCDGSTNNPVLTANDFQCFLNSYAGGCS